MAKAASLASSLTIAKGMASPSTGDTPASAQLNLREPSAPAPSPPTAGAQRIDPKKITASQWANRHESSFASSAFEDLKREIAAAGGNVQPIKVRPLSVGRSNTGSETFEVVYGHRRHRACLELGLPVLGFIEPVTDRVLFEEMERENRNRDDLSAWEQGHMYARALESGLYPSMRKLAEALNRDVADVSRAVKLAALSPTIIGAFASPLDLQFRFSKPLSDAWEKDPQSMEARAKLLHGSSLPAKEVVEQLIGIESVGPSNTAIEIKSKEGSVVALMTPSRNGTLALKINEKLDPAKQKKLVAFLENLF